jgi:hypothetical protein
MGIFVEWKFCNPESLSMPGSRMHVPRGLAEDEIESPERLGLPTHCGLASISRALAFRDTSTSVLQRFGVQRSIMRSVEVFLYDPHDSLRHVAVGEIGRPTEVRCHHYVVELS